ncbi:LysR family transcriptional regulator [Klebsiella pneumoniae]|uniref:LysR family transcriptional regulator n=1 Tax=Klebsiella pneumoniae TaxID=573 RepID=UPI0027B9D37B|nr:LysR family transcriptional regulator [Klebsiella pneumoniae]WLX39920.1 LysR family transcriptional regulator [Klebsiella pneumoniae]
MELRQCRYFISVAKLGSISQAALELHIAQPALTRQMQKLEEDLRVTLFNRTGRGVQLTDAGSQFLVDAEILINNVTVIKFSLLKRRPVRHRAEYDRLYLTRDQQLSCFDPIANREHQRASTTREYRRNWRTSSVRLK